MEEQVRNGRPMAVRLLFTVIKATGHHIHQNLQNFMTQLRTMHLAWGVLQSAKCLPCKQRDLRLMVRTYILKGQVW